MKAKIAHKYLYRCYDDLAVLYDKTENIYVIFEDVFADMFNILMNESGEPDNIVRKITELYDVDEETVQADFVEFYAELENLLVANNSRHEANVDADKYEETENYIFDLMTERQIPFTANIEITDRCNLKCKHCYRSQESLTLWNLESFEKALIELKRMGTLHVVFAGSEPLMHPEILGFLALIEKYGFVLTLQSNATLLNDDILAALKRCTVKMVFVSLYTDKAELHDFITGHVGSYDKTIEAIIKLKNAGIVVRASVSIFDANEDEVYAVNSLCDELGIKPGYNFKIIPAIESFKDTTSMNAFDEKKMLEYITDSGLKLYEESIKKSRQKEGLVPKHYCTTGFRSITITYDLNVVICNAFRKVCGSFKEMPLEEIWKNSKELNYWRNVSSIVNEKCSSCKAFQYCEPCPAHNYTATGDDSKIDTNTCEYGTMFKKVCDIARGL